MSNKTQAQLEAVYRKNRKSFLARIRKMTGNLADAEDMLQDAFARAASGMSVLENVNNIPAWIFSVIRNRVIDFWRRRQSHRKAGEVEVAEETIREIIDQTGLDPADSFIREEIADALTDAVAELPPEQREVIEAQAIDGMTFAVMSEKTGVPANTLMTRKKIAVKKLCRALNAWIE